MVKYRLTYFNTRGRGETIRLCFVAAGIKFEDKRIEIKDWQAMKEGTPWQSLPVLEFDGNTVGESMAIARYVAREAGLMGSNKIQEAHIDDVVDKITELREKAVKLKQAPEGKKAKVLNDFLHNTLPSILPHLDRYAASNQRGSGYFVGQKISLADIHFFSIIEILLPNMPNILTTHPSLNRIYHNVQQHPRIAEYLKGRPAYSF